MPIPDYAALKPLYSLMLEEIENTSRDTSSGTMVRQAAHIDILMRVLYGAPLPHFGFRGSLGYDGLRKKFAMYGHVRRVVLASGG